MAPLITKRPSGNSNQRRRAWRQFKAMYEPLGYVCKRKKQFIVKGKQINVMFIAKLEN
jgi:hypothetical protein